MRARDIWDRVEKIRRPEEGQEGIVPCTLLQPVVAKGEAVCSDWHHEPDIAIFGDCQACRASL